MKVEVGDDLQGTVPLHHVYQHILNCLGKVAVRIATMPQSWLEDAGILAYTSPGLQATRVFLTLPPALPSSFRT